MVDCREHLDMIERAGAGQGSRPVRVCIDMDGGWRLLGGRMLIGARRSPVRTPEQAAALAQDILARGAGLRLAGMMAYEAQIAGLGDSPAGRPLRAMAIRAVQARSGRGAGSPAGGGGRRGAGRPRRRRGSARCEFVNGGGTGSLERTTAEPAVTELAAGSGLYGPALFDPTAPSPRGPPRSSRLQS